MVKKIRFKIVLLIWLAALGAPFFGVKAQELKRPVIISVDKSGYERTARPLITGLTQAETEVMIYINDYYHGLAEINSQNTATDNFYFQTKETLPEGKNLIKAVARNKETLILSQPSEVAEIYVAPLMAPVLIEPNENTITGMVKPFITGLTESGTIVHIYINGVYNGKTEMAVHKSGTANFAYKPFLNLETGWHSAWAVAESPDGRKSPSSNVINFYIEEKMPAPTLLEVVKTNDYQKPLITGLAKNDSQVKVFINHKLFGQFQVENNESGTANFAYEPFIGLTEGNHLVYTVAIDSKGKESVWSNIIYFNVAKPIEVVVEKDVDSVMDSEKEEKTDPKEVEVKGEEMPVQVIEPEKEEPKTIFDQEAEAEETEEVGLDVISDQTAAEAEETGSLDETKEKQGKFSWNLIIFILFLLAVIIWIFWVNRELIKEKREKREKEKNSENKDNS